MIRRLESQIKDSQPDETYMFQEIKEIEGDDLDLNGIIQKDKIKQRPKSSHMYSNNRI